MVDLLQKSPKNEAQADAGHRTPPAGANMTNMRAGMVAPRRYAEGTVSVPSTNFANDGRPGYLDNLISGRIGPIAVGAAASGGAGPNYEGQPGGSVPAPEPPLMMPTGNGFGMSASYKLAPASGVAPDPRDNMRGRSVDPSFFSSPPAPVWSPPGVNYAMRGTPPALASATSALVAALGGAPHAPAPAPAPALGGAPSATASPMDRIGAVYPMGQVGSTWGGQQAAAAPAHTRVTVQNGLNAAPVGYDVPVEQPGSVGHALSAPHEYTPQGFAQATKGYTMDQLTSLYRSSVEASHYDPINLMRQELLAAARSNGDRKGYEELEKHFTDIYGQGYDPNAVTPNTSGAGMP